jgi:hypothetical protein
MRPFRLTWLQSGAELAYLLGHDPEFRNVKREHLMEAGKRVRLKDHVKLLAEILAGQVGQALFQFVIISADPQDVVQSALEGMVPPENIFGIGIRPDHTVYIGDGSSDLYVMHHVNSRDGHTIAVSETKDIGRIAQRTVLSEDATSVSCQFSRTSSNGAPIRSVSFSKATAYPFRAGTKFAPIGSRFTRPRRRRVKRPPERSSRENRPACALRHRRTAL